ncbi:MAG: CoA transferase [Chloroflexi bacterium]|nr:CoA transferase [Chloroflexota bacterium]
MEQNTALQSLYGIRILDLSQGIVGPFCAKQLADFGADVIKVERPGTGDWARRVGPFPGDVPHPEKSGLFLFLNTNKRGITLDLKITGGVEALKELVKDADMLVESYKPGVMERLGLGYETLKEINPDLIMTSVSNFGQTGPYRDYKASELIFFGMGGRMTPMGLPDRYPLKLGGSHVQYQAGNVAALATLFAWYGREHQDMGGQHVDISIFETQMGSINGRLSSLLAYQYNGERSKRTAGPRQGYPGGTYRAKDGYVMVNGAGARWPLTVNMLGMPGLLEDPRFAGTEGQRSQEGKEEFERTIWTPWLMARTAIEVMEECQKYEIPSVAVSTMDQVVHNNPQFEAREYLKEIDHPVAGKLLYPGAPIYSPREWWSIRRPAPTLGQHNREVLGNGADPWGQKPGQTSKELESARTSRPSRGTITTVAGGENGNVRLPLEGIRALAFTLVYAGPYGAMFLADIGAEVIRVEPLNFMPMGGRGNPPVRVTKEEAARAPSSNFPNRDPGERPWNRLASPNAYIRNKYSISGDIASPEGRGAFRKLVEQSDLIIENNVPGSMKRLGISYEEVSQWNPRIIMISSCGCGQTGPWSHFRGYGSNFEALLCGHATVMGYPDMGPEGSPGSVPSDAATGATIAIAAIMALRERERTGKGMHVDIGMGEVWLPYLAEQFMDYTINGRVAGPTGNRDHNGHLVQGAYQCAGDDEWIAISIAKIEQWRALCRLMDKPELIEERRFADMAGLRANHDDVDEIISGWTVDKDPIELFHLLQGEGIPAGPLLHEAHAYRDPHLKEREFFVEITHAETGTHLYPGAAFKMSKVPFVVRKPPVRLGEDNDYVYREVMKLSDEEYDRLKALGQIGMDLHPSVK